MTQVQDKQDVWSEVVIKLIQLTQDGLLEWESAVPPTTTEDELIDSAYITEYADRHLRIYERRYKRPSGPIGIAFFPEGSGWASEIVLEFVGSHGESLWRFPQTRISRDLLRAIQYKVAGVKEFLDVILS
jgi:hypothetical protein